MRKLGWSRMLAFYGVMGGIGVAAIAWEGAWDRIVPGLDPVRWGVAIGLGLGVGVAMVVGSRVANAYFAWARRLTEEFRHILGDLRPREALLVAILSGVGEEILFRGVLQPALGLWLASAVFGVLHVGPNVRFLPWTVMAFLAGLTFGLMFAWTGTVLAPMLAHMVVNYLNLRYLAVEEEEEISMGPMGGESTAAPPNS